MKIKTATLIAIIGVSLSLVLAGASIPGPLAYLMEFGRAADTPLLLASTFAFFSLHIGLLVFLVCLYRRQ